MAKSNNLQDYLKDLYAGISARKPDASRNPQDFRREIENLVFTGDATAYAYDIRIGKTAYVNDVKLTGTIPNYDGSFEGVATESNDTFALICNGGVTGYSNSALTKIPAYAFAWMTTLKTISLPNLRYAGDYAFAWTNAALVIDLPSLTSKDSAILQKTAKYQFYYSGIRKAILPKMTILDNTFNTCQSLVLIDLTDVVEIGTNSFASCNALETVILRGDTMPVLEGSIPTRSLQGIYVKDSLVDNFLADGSWSRYADYIKPLSEYVEEDSE